MIKEAVRGIRNVRTGMNVPPSKKAKVFVVSEKRECEKYVRKRKSILCNPWIVQAK